MSTWMKICTWFTKIPLSLNTEKPKMIHMNKKQISLTWGFWPATLFKLSKICPLSEIVLNDRAKLSCLAAWWYYTIIGRGWAKYRDLSVASRSIICRCRRQRQIIDLRATDKSRYFAIAEFNNFFIIHRLVYAQIQGQLTKKGEFFNFF